MDNFDCVAFPKVKCHRSPFAWSMVILVYFRICYFLWCLPRVHAFLWVENILSFMNVNMLYRCRWPYVNRWFFFSFSFVAGAFCFSKYINTDTESDVYKKYGFYFGSSRPKMYHKSGKIKRRHVLHCINIVYIFSSLFGCTRYANIAQSAQTHTHTHAKTTRFYHILVMDDMGL